LPTDWPSPTPASPAGNTIGDVLVAQGNIAEAMKSYRAKQDIISRLAKSDPGNASWQRDLSVSPNKIGDVCWWIRAICRRR
jgi:hypothetical protein